MLLWHKRGERTIRPFCLFDVVKSRPGAAPRFYLNTRSYIDSVPQVIFDFEMMS